MTEHPEVIIYTDGACDPNPGPGGWAVLLRFGEHEKVLTGMESRSTNNRMELQAVIAALTALKKPCRAIIHTDSKYVKNGVTAYLARWKAQHWQTSDKKAVANQDLWQQLDEATQRHQIEWVWVKGHAGNPLNERVDQLAVSMIPRSALPLDDETATHVFTGVSCRGQTGPGGWATIVRTGNVLDEISGYEAVTSANRLHLLAALRGLESAPRDRAIHLYTPSDYVARGAEQWIEQWAARGWRTQDDQAVKHRELWQAIAAVSKTQSVHWHCLKEASRPPLAVQAERVAKQIAHNGNGRTA